MAIALDATSTGTASSATDTRTWSHTCAAGSILVVGAIARDAANAADTVVSTLTYNGVALTKIRHNDCVSATCRTEIWYTATPATGANNIVITWAGVCADLVAGGAISLTGCHASPYDADNGFGATVNDTQITVDVTTVADNSWVVDVVFTGEPTTLTAGGGQTEFAKQLGVGLGGGGSADSVGMSYEGPKTPAGAVTMSWTFGSSQRGCISAASFKPAVSGSKQLLTLGCG